jgi:hypothetical protein
MIILAVTVLSSVWRQVSTCSRMGSKFRCIRSVPTEMASTSEKLFRVFGQDRLKVAMNNMAKLPFELSVPISRARLKPHRETGIVEY